MCLRTKTSCWVSALNSWLPSAKPKTSKSLSWTKARTTFEEDLAKDVLEVITVFSARLDASRSRKNQQLLEGIKRAVEESRR